MAEAQMICAAAFVEGGVQDACDDACSICLENFGENNPATITTCRHEYHLQCILEWSQRSKDCPMCWQPLCLKDPDSQSLLAASEQERVLRHQRSSHLSQRSVLDNTQFHRFAPSYGDDSDLEDRIMHHLAAAAMGRAHQFARRGESMRFRPSPGNIFLQGTTSQPDALSLGVRTAHAAPSQSSSAYTAVISEPVGGESDIERDSRDLYSLRRQAGVEHADSPQGVSSSEPSIPETFKSRLVSASSRYRESLTKTTRGFRERLRVRNGALVELGTRAREVSAGVVRALERMSLESHDKNGDSSSAPSSSAGTHMHRGTMAVHLRPSCESEGAEGKECSAGSMGETVDSGSMTASSSTNTGTHMHRGTMAVHLRPSFESEGAEGKECSAGSMGETVDPGSMTASSSANTALQ